MSAVKSSYWKNVPRKTLAGFLLGVFFIFCTMGFQSDIVEMGRQPWLRFVLGVTLSGLFAAFYAGSGIVLRGQFWKAFVPAFVVHFVLMGLLANLLPSQPQNGEMSAAALARLQNRLNIDVFATFCAIALGYGCFVYVTITKGRRYLRVHAEMLLAAEIHHVLVPSIDAKLGQFEFYGQSAASGEVGGDLIDVAGTEDHWVGYVADVSGHGVAPGVVMGMVKSASRMLLNSGNDGVHLMPRLNEVLYPLKKPDMFVTFCFVAKNGSGLLVGLAGHPPILQFCARTREVRALESPNMPLGILPATEFQTWEIAAEAGDVFALYTDGLLETVNAAGEEYGRQRLEAELQGHGKESLQIICRSVRESVAKHGAQFDDQSLLLIRKCC